jgi:hypothetical protein
LYLLEQAEENVAEVLIMTPVVDVTRLRVKRNRTALQHERQNSRE